MCICFTDASYDPQMKIGVIVFRIYLDGIKNEYQQYIEIINNIKNSELEKIGINKCIKATLNYNDVTIYTDCQSGMDAFQNDRISMNYIKGHDKKSNRDDIGLIFREVDILARKELRRLRNILK